jgi:hypothetical protein
MSYPALDSADFRGGSSRSSQLSDTEEKIVQREANKIALRKGYASIEKWSDGDMVLNDLRLYFLEAKEIAKAQGVETQVIWHQLKKRPLQELQGDPVTSMFKVSDHHQKLFRSSWAEALETHPADEFKAAELAWELFHERKNSEGHKAGYEPDQRTKDAWDSQTANYQQLSLFSTTEYEDGEAIELIDALPDESATAPDCGYQMNFLDEVMSDDGPFDLRQQLICTYLMEEPKPTYEEIGKRMEPPCSSSTIGEEVKKIRELSLGLLDAMEIT